MSEGLMNVLIIAGMLAVVGVPLLLLWLKDKGGCAGAMARGILGGISLLFGLTLAGWLVYNLFHPTPEFHAAVPYTGGLVVLALVHGISTVWGFLHAGRTIVTVPGPSIYDIWPDPAAPEFGEAHRRVLETLPGFIAQLPLAKGAALVKCHAQRDDGTLLDEWTYAESYMNGCFIVEENPASAHVGRWDKVATILCLVSENEVVDWRIIHPDKSESGNFTTIAAFAVLARQGTPLSPKMEQERARLRDG